MVETINGTTRTTSYTYDADNRVTSITNSGNDPNSTVDDITEWYTYDTYGRIHTKVTTYGGATIHTETYAYVGDDSGTPSTQVESIQTVFSNGESVTYSYGYDANGNIISSGDGSINETTYIYDSANQLVRENNGRVGLTWLYDYDNAGNVSQHMLCFFSTTDSLTELEEENYTYGDSEWGDLLTGWNGKTVTSDSIGNMLSNGTWSYTWEHGRELASMTDGSSTWSFSYDANGMRTGRSNGTRTYSYIYNGSKLSQLVVDGHTLRFTYDASGSPLSVNYDGTEYYYVLNLQGDVRAILDGSGNKVVIYNYDAWGNIRWAVGGSMADTLGLYNPLCYRGYVYDSEYKLYYLQSRYYDPEIGRFISADAYAATGQGILGNNMFAYCGNNPVVHEDSEGNMHRASLKENNFANIDGGGAAGILIPIGIGFGLLDWLEDIERQIQEKMTLSLSKAKSRNYKTEQEEHHIAAKKAKNAEAAAKILSEVLPNGVEDPANKIWVYTDVHRRVHTNLYYVFANEIIIFAYGSANGDKLQQVKNVNAALLYLRTFIETLNALSNIKHGG